jgi:hypothetical protein
MAGKSSLYIRAGMKPAASINPKTNAANPTAQHLSRNNLLLELVLQTTIPNTLESTSAISITQGAIHEHLSTNPKLFGNEEKYLASASLSSLSPSSIDVAPVAKPTQQTNLLCGIGAFIPIESSCSAAN